MIARKKKILEALEKSLGIVSTACKSCGIDRKTFYNYKKNDPEFKARVEDIQNVCIDFVETQLFKQIKAGNTAATIFYLKTKGKERGYTEKKEIAISSGNELTESEIKAELKKMSLINDKYAA